MCIRWMWWFSPEPRSYFLLDAFHKLYVSFFPGQIVSGCISLSLSHDSFRVLGIRMRWIVTSSAVFEIASQDIIIQRASHFLFPCLSVPFLWQIGKTVYVWISEIWAKIFVHEVIEWLEDKDNFLINTNNLAQSTCTSPVWAQFIEFFFLFFLTCGYLIFCQQHLPNRFLPAMPMQLLYYWCFHSEQCMCVKL